METKLHSLLHECPTEIKIIGSSVLFDDYNDIDIFTTNEAHFSKMLFMSRNIETEIHPVLVSKKIFDDIESLSTFYNICACKNADGQLKYAHNFIKSKGLIFNPNSLRYFTHLRKVKNLTEKLVSRGYNISDEEINKIIGYFDIYYRSNGINKRPIWDISRG